MKKFFYFPFAVIVCSFFCTTAQAQNKFTSIDVPAATDYYTSKNTTVDCDSVNYPVPVIWHRKVYGIFAPGSDSVLLGGINGTNYYYDRQKANYFDLSKTPYKFISGARIVFNYAHTSDNTHRDSAVIIRILRDDNGKPGTEIANTAVPYGSIIDSVDLVNMQNPPLGHYVPAFYTVNLPASFELPASRKFYLSVDFSHLTLDSSRPKTEDRINIISTQDGDVPVGTAWEMNRFGEWKSYVESYSYEQDTFNITLGMFPFVSTGADGCTVLPLNLISFNAQRNNADVTLSWQVSNELNMNKYEVERADNNGIFNTVATLKALNTYKQQSYSITDKNAFVNFSTVQYRLKQVDVNGSAVYSRVISLKSNTIISDVSFMNPFMGALKIQLNLSSAQAVSVKLYDMQGKLVANENEKTYSPSSNTIIMNAAANLQTGLYVLKIVAGTEQAVYKIMKQ